MEYEGYGFLCRTCIRYNDYLSKVDFKKWNKYPGREILNFRNVCQLNNVDTRMTRDLCCLISSDKTVFYPFNPSNGKAMILCGIIIILLNVFKSGWIMWVNSFIVPI